MDISRGRSSCPLFPGRIGIWNVSFRDGRETEGPGKKTLGARMRTNHKLKPHVKPGPGMEPRPQRMEGKRFYLCASPAPNKRPK